MRRVLMIIPNLDFGGAQKSFARITRLLSPYYDIGLVVFNKDNIAPLPFGAPLIDLEVKGANTYVGKIISFFRRVKRLKAIKKKFKPDVSISFLEGADYVNLLSKGKEKIWFYVHGSKVYDRNISGIIGFFRKKFFLPMSFSKADKILVVNARIREELVDHFSVTKVPIVVMKNFYDLEELDTLAKEEMPPNLQTIFNDFPTVSISGRIASEKGIDRFIKALPAVLGKVENVKVMIVGDGPHRENVIEACRKEKIEWCIAEEDVTPGDFSKTVFFLGYKKNPYPFIKHATILALPSLNEGMPNTIAEALILGTQVIASDCPYGPWEILGGGNLPRNTWPVYAPYGVLLPVPDRTVAVDSLWSRAIVELIEAPELRKEFKSRGLTQRAVLSKEAILNDWKKLLSPVS